MTKFWNFTGGAGGERTLYLIGGIAETSWWGDEATPERFKADLDAGRGDLCVWINSQGGDVFSAARIYTMLREYAQSGKGRVTVKIEGIAASAASVVAMAGEKTLMSPVSYMLIHNPYTAALGNEGELARTQAMLAEVKEGIINAYQAKTGLQRAKISQLMDEETMLSAHKAVGLRFADGILYDGDTAGSQGGAPANRAGEAAGRAGILNSTSKGGILMGGTLELREKRAKAWEAAKAFLDSKRGADGLASEEDIKVYERMEADVNAMGRQIDLIERQNALDRELGAAANTPLTQQPATGALSAAKPTAGRASADYSRAFWAVIRNPKSDRDPAVYNALSVGTDAEGGYLVPDEFERALVSALEEHNIMRGLARRLSTTSGELKIPVVATRGTASWVDEAGTIADSDGSFSQVTLNAYKMATLIKVSHELLEDSAFQLEPFLAEDFGRRLGSLEEEAFLVGDGAKKPTGIIIDAQVGATAASASAITFDDVIKLYYSLRSPYRNKAVFIANEQTVLSLRLLKDSNGQYLWQPSVTAGTPDTLIGRPLYVSGFVPVIGSGAKTLLFGDLSYYWINDRQGRSFERLNELFSINDQIGFKATQRVDGKLILPEAVKVLQMAT